VSGDALIDMGEAAISRIDFVRFLNALKRDFDENGDQWENSSLGDFLDALAAWSEDCPKYYRNMGLQVDPDQPQWRVFADMLLAAKVYE
jgi:hypothetical protein